MTAWDTSKKQESYSGLTEKRRCWLRADAAFYIATGRNFHKNVVFST